MLSFESRACKALINQTENPAGVRKIRIICPSTRFLHSRRKDSDESSLWFHFLVFCAGIFNDAMCVPTLSHNDVMQVTLVGQR